MSSKKPKATRKRMISCFAQIVEEHIPGWKIEEIASGEKVKARKFSYSSQVYLLMLSQFLHLFSLNEIVDVSKIYAAELSRVRGITPANLNTFSNANRTRDPKVMQTFFWTVYGIFRNEEPDFTKRNSSRHSSSRTSTYGENENAVEECARTKGVGSGERSELRSSLKAPRRYGMLSWPISSCGGSSTGRVRRAATRASPRSSGPSSG